MQQSFAHNKLLKNIKYYVINMKVNKAYHAIDDTMKKDYFLNKI